MPFTDPTRPPLTPEQKAKVSRRLLKLFLRQELGLMSNAKLLETIRRISEQIGVDVGQIREVADEIIEELADEMLGRSKA